MSLTVIGACVVITVIVVITALTLLNDTIPTTRPTGLQICILFPRLPCVKQLPLLHRHYRSRDAVVGRFSRMVLPQRMAT